MANITDITTAKGTTPKAKAYKYLSDRGISPQTAAACKLEVHGVTHCLERLGATQSVPFEAGIIFPMGSTGAVQVAFVSRVHTLEVNPLSKHNTANRPGCRMGLFCPPIDWSSTDTLYLCESPTKAAAMYQRGYSAVSGFGVSTIYNRRSGFIADWPDDKILALKRVVILFDADHTENKQVASAIKWLVTGLELSYPDLTIEMLKLLPLPDDAAQTVDEKAGVDDWIAATEKAGLADWLHDFVTTAEPAPEMKRIARELDELNLKYVACASPAGIINRYTGAIAKPGSVQFIEATRTFMDHDGEKPKRVVPFDEWVAWPERNTVHELRYIPQGATFSPPEFYNTWVDDSAPAVAGSVEPFLAVYENAIPEPEERKALYDCMAFIVQQPTVRLPKVLYFVGRAHGTGKSLLASVVRRMVGESNCGEISPEDLSEQFNDHWARSQVVWMDDVVKLSRVQNGKLKKLITSETVTVAQRFVDSVRLKSYLVFVITANERDAVTIAPGDRRVLTVSFAPAVHHDSGGAYWNDYVAWLEKDGYGHLKHWLLNRDLHAFIPAFMPPDTEAREELTEINKDPDEQFHLDVQQDPDSALCTGRSVFTSDELWPLMRDGQPGDLLKFGRILRTLGFRQANNGHPVAIDGARKRYWALRPHARKWQSSEVRDDVKKYPLNVKSY